MWVEITKDIFEHSNFKSLNYLYQILSWFPSDSKIPRYNILVDIESVEKTENFKKLSEIEEESMKELLNLEFTNFALTSNGAKPYYKISNKKSKDYFNIEEAILFFTQPVSIVLENNKNDSLFIHTIIKYFGEINGINKSYQHLENGWIQFENAGGCSNIPNFIKGFLHKFKRIAQKNNRPMSDYFRGIIIIDSDKEYENQPPKHLNLISNLNRLGIVSDYIHILKKRMMENYLPKEVFEDIRRQPAIQITQKLKDWLDVYFSLTHIQMDFLNIADGFPPKSNKIENGVRKPVNPEILNLYNMAITDLNFKKLDSGFDFRDFDYYGRLKTNSSFKDEFPNLFRKSIVNKANLENRDNNGELQEIAEKINSLL